MSTRRLGLMVVLPTSIVALGYVLMRAQRRTDEEAYAALPPDLQRRVDARRAERFRAEAAAAAREAQSQDPSGQPNKTGSH